MTYVKDRSESLNMSYPCIREKSKFKLHASDLKYGSNAITVGIIVQYSFQRRNQELDLYVGILPTSENCLAEKDRRSSQRSSQEERILERKKTSSTFQNICSCN
jgi:hypothetical protein